MDKDAGCFSTQLIDGDGTFNDSGIKSFLKEVKLADCGHPYAIVSIMGPQSSGKSTLLNHLFRTNFREMDALRGRTQTTKGIWLANCVGLEPCTLVMDLEGTDGRERGEDDTAFEKRSALFALAVSDIVLVNMWCHDIGREQAANRPLLKTVFQVMMRLFSPHKKTLMFVIRDKTRTPLANLEPVLREDIQKIWDSVPKPQAHKDTPLSEFFSVEVVALSSYEEKEEQFKEQVAKLRQQFIHSIASGGLAGDGQGVVPASDFYLSVKQIWNDIKENRDLDIPAHKVMVATVRCEEIVHERYKDFTENQGWLQLEQESQTGPVVEFGKKLSSIIGDCLFQYDSEVVYYDKGVRTSKRKDLEAKLLQVVQPAFHSILGHLRSGTMEKFKEAFDKALSGGEGFSAASHRCKQNLMKFFDEECADAVIKQSNWDISKVRSKLVHDLDEHIASVRAAKLAELTSSYKEKLNKALAGPVGACLANADNRTWQLISQNLQSETESAASGLARDLSGFDLDEETIKKKLAELKIYARDVVEGKAKEEAGLIFSRMVDRFSKLFNRDSDLMLRDWTGNENIESIKKHACSSCIELLSVLAAIRLDDESDDIYETLSAALVDNRSLTTSDPLASSTWEKVPPSKTLLTPVRCKSLWQQFQENTEFFVSRAILVQEAHKRSNNWLPPQWLIIAMLILGFNGFTTLLGNPVCLCVRFDGYLVIKALWVQMDISTEFSHGILPGVLSLSTRILPTVMNMLRNLAERGNRPAITGGHTNPPLAANGFRDGVNTDGLSSAGSSSVTRNENRTEFSSSSKED